jgi:biotin transport system substrate-specific component
MSTVDSALSRPTLADALWPATPASKLSRSVILAVGGTVLLWLSGKIQVPLYPVPMTMQTLVVLSLGIAYGPRLGTATVGLYLLEAAVGLPVLAGGWSEGAGFHHLYGPTGGYLLGFVVAAAVCGRLAERGWDRSMPHAAAAMVIGNLIIYALGLAWLSVLIGITEAIKYGLLPFLLGDLLKIALGTCGLPAVWKGISAR